MDETNGIDGPLILSLLERATYQPAKTAIKNPHEYTLRKNWRDEVKFFDAVLFIWSHGRVEMFWGKPYICYYHQGYKYWTDCEIWETCRLINRCRY